MYNASSNPGTKHREDQHTGPHAFPVTTHLYRCRAPANWVQGGGGDHSACPPPPPLGMKSLMYYLSLTSWLPCVQENSYNDIIEAVEVFVVTFDPPLLPALQGSSFESQISVADDPPDYDRANRVLKVSLGNTNVHQGSRGGGGGGAGHLAGCIHSLNWTTRLEWTTGLTFESQRNNVIG